MVIRNAIVKKELDDVDKVKRIQQEQLQLHLDDSNDIAGISSYK
jgi:hypothetical protein